MENQIVADLGKGALIDRPDSRDFLFSEIGADLPPFHWNEEGFNVEKKLQERFGSPGFRVPIKNQGKTYSCGGQAESYYGEVLEALDSGTFEERSAKFIYAQTFIPNAGSYMRDNAEIATKQGWGKEALTSSYQFNMVPTEEFMTRPQDITDYARFDAKTALSRSYAYVNLDIDSVAQAVKAGSGAVMLIRGENNGTWLTEHPRPGRDSWGHFMYIGGANLVNGIKTLHAMQSWGDKVGNAGWQSFEKEWFDQKRIVRVLTHVYSPGPVQSFHHTFTKPLEYGQTDPEVINLQKALQYLKFFPATVPFSSHFGNITRGAVLKMQLSYMVDSVDTLARLNGTRVGAKTNMALSRIFA